MRLRLPSVLLLPCLCVGGCTPPKPPPPGPSNAAGTASETSAVPTSAKAAPAYAVTYDEEALGLFKERYVSGSFILSNETAQKQIIVGRDDIDRRRLPCSTFKIANTLIGLETGVIPDARFSLPWDGKKRTVPEWNRDQDLASAMRYSVVWFYQEVARRIGMAQMKAWVDKLDYGNHKVEGPIDAFWLDDGSLAISAREQATFLRRIRTRDLPVSPENIAVLEKVFPAEQVGAALVYGKTGLCTDQKQAVGWLVGWIDDKKSRWVYALGIAAAKSDVDRIMPIRRELAHALLRRENVL
jgi:beta-lactamase class D